MCLYDPNLSSDTQVTTLSQSPLNYCSEHYSMIQQYLTLKHSLHSFVPIKQVGDAAGAPRKTYLQSAKHNCSDQETRTQTN